MTLEHLRDSLPDYAKDMKLNLSNVLAQTELNEQQLWGTALACAMAAGSPTLLAAIANEAKSKLNPVAFTAAKIGGIRSQQTTELFADRAAGRLIAEEKTGNRDNDDEDRRH